MKSLFTALFLVVGSCGVLFGQSAYVRGVINDGETGEPFPFATVKIENTASGSVADLEGKYVLKLSPGTYNLIYSYVGYVDERKENVTVSAGQELEINVTLNTDSKTLSDIVITGEKRNDTEFAAVEKVKAAEQVVSAVSAQEISKIEASNAGDVVSRVPGVTIIDGKFVIVRGLGQRYNSVQMNGMTMPSVDPSTKAFTFDIVPSSILESALTYKSFSPDLSGEVAGGAINIFTKNSPSYDYHKASFKLGYRVGTTLENAQTDPYRDVADVFAFGKASREFPEGVADAIPTKENYFIGDGGEFSGQNALSDQQIARFDNSDFFSRTFSVLPDLSASYEMGKIMDIKGKELSMLNAVSVSNSTKTVESFDQRVSTWEDFIPTNINYNARSVRTSRTSKLMLMSNYKYKLSNNIDLKWQNLYNRIGTSSVLDRDEINEDRGRQDGRISSINYTDKIILSTQLTGTIWMNDFKDNLDIIAGFAQTKFTMPNRRSVFNLRSLGDEQPHQVEFAPGGAALIGVTRFASDMRENATSLTLNYKHLLSEEDEDGKAAYVKAGAYFEVKDRQFNANNFSYGTPASSRANRVGALVRDAETILTNPDLLQVFVDESTVGVGLYNETTKVDQYDATNTTMATYVSFFVPFSNFEISPGLRLENNIQQIQAPAEDQTSTVPLDINRDNLNLLPYFNATYRSSDRSQFRLAYARTVNRPELRELAPFSFYDFFYNRSMKGDPNLVSAVIDNLDMRYEFYPREADMIGIGLFYKNFDKPIELVNLSANDEFQFQNMNSAISYGLEFEMRSDIAKSSTSSFLQNSSVLFNAALIGSQTKLSLENARRVNEDRPLQGQSPYVVNAGWYFDNEDNGLGFNLNYNVYGRRIVVSEANSTRPPIYELPRHLIDLSVSKKLRNDWKIKLAATNILNAEFRYYYDGNFDEKIDQDSENDQLFQRYREGQKIEFSISRKF